VGSDPSSSLQGLEEALATFLKLGDTWGQSRTWLARARIEAAGGREDESSFCAERSQSADPGWEDPPVFLARLALERGALDEAERLLSPLRSPDAERELQIVFRIREGVITAESATSFLRELDSPPGPHSVEAMQSLALRYPAFHPARELLGWHLLKIGRYADANVVLRELLDQPLPSCELSWVRLGLGCIANALKRGKPESRLLAAVGDPRRDSGPHVKVPGTPPPSTPGARTVFSGYLGIFAMPDVLEFLRSGRRTGLLVLSSEAGMGALRFSEGQITGGAAPGVKSLGEMLLAAGAIDKDSLDAAAAGHKPGKSESILGEVLVREGRVGAAAVREAVIAQIRSAIRVLIGWSDGQFAFDREEQAPLASSATAVSLDPQELLLDAYREQDEAARDAGQR
jgi:Domain of unknown function (DUF4388)